MKLTQEELDILENAPEGATHWMTHIIQDSEYAAFIEAEDCYRLKPFDEDLYICDGTWVATPLADLRKRKEQEDNQQKIVDAVNELKADLGNDKGHFRSMSYIVKFNQCVKDMTNIVSDDLFCEYSRDKTPLEPEQKPVEWVNGQECIYNDDSHYILMEHNRYSGLFVLGNKADTSVTAAWGKDLSKPVTKEKRWVVYDKDGDFYEERNTLPASVISSWQVIEIEVNV